MERYYSNAQFVERKLTISNVAQEESESSSDAWELFKLLLLKCSDHNMNSIEHMTHLIDGLRTQLRMLLDAPTRGTLRAKASEELKTLIENMCHNGAVEIQDLRDFHIFTLNR